MASTRTISSTVVGSLDSHDMEEQTKQERLQELDLQYRKERAGRRRRGNSSVIVESEEYDEAAVTLQIIDKDLQRLPPRPPSSASQQAVSIASRVALLRQVLFCLPLHHASHSWISTGNA